MEVLAAMFIAALAAAAVVAVLPPAKPDTEKAAERLATALVRAQRASVIEGASIGLVMAPSGYSFAHWRDGEWAALDRASGLGPADWPDGALVQMTSETISEDDELPEGFPAVTFDATGGATPFTVRLDGRAGRALVRLEADGAVTVETPDV